LDHVKDLTTELIVEDDGIGAGVGVATLVMTLVAAFFSWKGRTSSPQG
jgi:hypothetical protein